MVEAEHRPPRRAATGPAGRAACPSARRVRRRPRPGPARRTSSRTARLPEDAARSPTRARSRLAPRARGGRGEPRAAPGSSAAPELGRGRPPLASTVLDAEQPVVDQHRSICSTKSGFPSAAATIDRACARRRARRRRAGCSTTRAALSAEAAERDRVTVGAGPPVRPHLEHLRPGGADEQELGASSAVAATGARSGRASAGSAQWMSSKTTTSGRRRASVSRSFRAAQNISWTGNCRPTRPIGRGDRSTTSALRSPTSAAELRAAASVGRVLADASRLAHDLGQRPERDAVAIGRQRPRRTRRLARRPA